MSQKPSRLLASLGILLSITTFILFAQVPDNVREIVKDPGEKNEDASAKIEIGKSIFGHPYGTTEKEFIKKEGKPDGYLSLSEGRTVLIYGSEVGFIFDDSKLSGVRITSAVIDWELGKQMSRKSRFDSIEWNLSNGFRDQMKLPDVEKLFKDKLINSDYRHFVVIGKDTLEIEFSTRVFQGAELEKFVGGILLTRE